MRERSQYVRLGLTVFCTVAGVLLFYDTLFGSRFLLRVWRQFLGASTPVLYGAFMAYLLSPLVNFFDRAALAIGAAQAPGNRGRRVSLGVRSLSILLVWALVLGVLYLLGSVLLPELYKSILQLAGNLENYYNTISGWVLHLLETYPSIEAWVTEQMNTYYQTLMSWVRNDLLPQAAMLMSIVSGGVVGVVRFFGDLLVGIIVSLYFLATKEICAAQGKRIACSLCTERHVYWILRGARKADRIFAGFVRGKLLDSLIIGVLCFIGCSILDFPYTPLVSVFVGVTNVIPFFGPFLGAIPSAFLILLASPRKALYFVIFVIALQQLDGNVIGPKILGDRTGLSNLWVIFAILVGGSFFGVAGMFFAVPVCACVYSLADFLVGARLRARHLPVGIDFYTGEPPLPVPESAPDSAPAQEAPPREDAP